MQSRCLSLGDLVGVWLERGSNFGGSELLDLLGSTTDKCTGVEEGVQLGDDGVEECCTADTLKQVVVFALLLHVVGCLVGEDT